jgi:hypothetical protein
VSDERAERGGGQLSGVDPPDDELGQVEPDHSGADERPVDGHEAVRVVGGHEQVLRARVAVHVALREAVEGVEQRGHPVGECGELEAQPGVPRGHDKRVRPYRVAAQGG